MPQEGAAPGLDRAKGDLITVAAWFEQVADVQPAVGSTLQPYGRPFERQVLQGELFFQKRQKGDPDDNPFGLDKVGGAVRFLDGYPVKDKAWPEVPGELSPAKIDLPFQR